MNSNSKEYVVYYGAGGAAKGYSEKYGLPDFFVDSDKNKWNSELNSVLIKKPEFLKQILIKKIVITTGYVNEVVPIIEKYVTDKSKILIPPKSHLGGKPFENNLNREIALKEISLLTEFMGDLSPIVYCGGTALGFARDNDFIKWDNDIDLVCPSNGKMKLKKWLESKSLKYIIDGEKLIFDLPLKNDFVPVGIKFYDKNKSTIVDVYCEYKWIWPITMFLCPTQKFINNRCIGLPEDPQLYLRKVYGKDWNKPKPDFGYQDYAKN